MYRGFREEDNVARFQLRTVNMLVEFFSFSVGEDVRYGKVQLVGSRYNAETAVFAALHRGERNARRHQRLPDLTVWTAAVLQEWMLHASVELVHLVFGVLDLSCHRIALLRRPRPTMQHVAF